MTGIDTPSRRFLEDAAPRDYAAGPAARAVALPARLGPVAAREPAACHGCAARRGLCGALAADELQDLFRVSRRRVLEPGERLDQDGDGEGLFANIQSGAVSLTRSLPDGRQQIVGIQFSPSFVGQPFGHYDFIEVLALGPVRLCSFSRPDFEKLLSRNRQLERRLLQQTLDQLDDARAWLIALGRKTALERVASYLVMLAEQSPEGLDGEAPRPIALPLSRGQMADFLGLTIETVSRKMTVLRKLDIIDWSELSAVRIVSRRKLGDAATH